MNNNLDYYLTEFKRNTNITSDVGFTKDLMLIVQILVAKGYSDDNFTDMIKAIGNLGK